MAASVRCKIDATDFSREQFRARLGWWTDRALEIDSPTRWVERFEGGTRFRRRYAWEMFAEVGDDVTSLALVTGWLPPLSFRSATVSIESSVPGFDRLLAQALRTRRRDMAEIMIRRCVVTATTDRPAAAMPTPVRLDDAFEVTRR